MSALFSPFALKDATLRNRVVIAPMCQYKATDGVIGDWQVAHLGARAIGGAGLVIAEGTAVSPEGRITPLCAGLWDDAQVAPWARVAAFVKAQGAVPGIQLAHAGRKGSANPPWIDRGASLAPGDPRAWEMVAPSAIAFGGNMPVAPREMGEADIAKAIADHVAATRRAAAAGFEWLELHFAHGYLAQTFLSPIANHRTDGYGGDAGGRARFLVECVDAVRAAWPERLPLTVKLGVTDFVPEGHDVAESIALVRTLAAHGVDLVDVSLGFNVPDMRVVPWGPGFMVPIAAEIRQATGVPVAVGWMIDRPEQAEAIVAGGQADLIHIARASLADPNWPYHAALALGEPQPWMTLPVEVGSWLMPPPPMPDAVPDAPPPSGLD